MAEHTNNPSQGLIPLSQTFILTARLNVWSRLVANLCAFLETIVIQEETFANQINTCFADVAQDLETDTIFHPDSSISLLLNKLVTGQSEMSSERLKWAEMIREQLIPILKELLGEIRKKALDVDREWVVLDTSLGKDLELYVKLVANVRKALVGHQWREPDSKDHAIDPWIANLALKKHISVCATKQDEYRSKLTAQQLSFSSFEIIVIQNIQVSLSTFFDYRSNCFAQQFDFAKQMSANITKISPKEDWSTFVQLHADRIFNPSLPLVTAKDLVYDGYDDFQMTAFKQGAMMRKEGVIVRTYKNVHIVLTRFGYLHIMPVLASGDPWPEAAEFSLDLSECTIQPLMMNEKEPEELTILERTRGVFGYTDVKHKLRGKTMTESVDWWGVINEQIRTQPKKIPKTLEVKEGRASLESVIVPVAIGKDSVQISTKAIATNMEKTRKSNDRLHSDKIPAPLPPRKLRVASNPLDKSLEDLPLSAVMDSFPQPEPDFASQPNQFEKVSLAEQMDLAMRSAKPIPAAIAPGPEFAEAFGDPSSSPLKSPTVNAWNTFQDDSGGW